MILWKTGCIFHPNKSSMTAFDPRQTPNKPYFWVLLLTEVGRADELLQLGAAVSCSTRTMLFVESQELLLVGTSRVQRW